MKKTHDPSIYTNKNHAAVFEKTALRVSVVSIIGNIFLTIIKMLAGILSGSGAMISDALHSASDVLTNVIVIIGVKASAKKPDREHPYGHERFECVAAIILAVVLLVCGLYVGQMAIEKLTADQAQEENWSGMIALLAAVISIILKEAMYWYTRAYAKRLDSGALLADAWHHRSDALCSIGALIGIVGAMMGFALMDTLAGIVICIFIIKAAYDIFRDAIGKMVDRACSEELEQQIAQCAAAQSDVLGVDLIKSRVFGNRIYVDVRILADAELSLTQSYHVAEQVHHAIEQSFHKVKHVTVCVIPVLKNRMLDEFHDSMNTT